MSVYKIMINLIKVVQIKEITQTTQSLSPLFFSSCVLCIQGFSHTPVNIFPTTIVLVQAFDLIPSICVKLIPSHIVFSN